MKKYLVRAYFKAGILVPFSTACFISLMFCASSSLYDFLELTFYSGLTGLCSLTVFLNCYRKVIDNFIYSLLSWFLLPMAFIAYVLATKVDWIVFKDTKRGDAALVAVYLVIFFLHFIGLFISFQSFRATVKLNPGNEEILNEEEEAYTMPNSDKDVKVCDATAAKQVDEPLYHK